MVGSLVKIPEGYAVKAVDDQFPGSNIFQKCSRWANFMYSHVLWFPGLLEAAL
jgi:hypothetical protein